MNMKKILSILAVLLLLGFAAPAQVEQSNQHDRLLPDNYAQQAAALSNAMKNSLTLTQVQFDSIRIINSDYFKKLKDLNGNSQLTRTQYVQQVQQTNSWWTGKVEAQLTALQVTKFRQDMEAMHQRTQNAVPGVQ
jgi:hypothetical protein